LRLKMGEGLIGHVALSGKPFISPDVRKEPRYINARAHTRSEMVAPIISNNEVIGVFDLESDELNAYTKDDLDVLMMLSSQVAIIIEKVMLHEQAIEKQRLETQLEVARQVQLQLLPPRDPQLEGFDISAYNFPTEEVSGDYYDWTRLFEDQIGIVIADVSGKGVPAALLMANLQACFRSQASAALGQPGEMLRIVNKQFYESTTAERFATLFFGLYDDRARRLRYVNCGHCPPFLLRANGALDRLPPTATPLGAFANWKCREADIELGVGDTLLLYSDGVTEAGIEGVEEFGEDRLAHAIRVNQWQPAEALVQAIVDDVADFSAGSRSDDVTVVGLRGI